LLPIILGDSTLSFVNAHDGYADHSPTGIFTTHDGGQHWQLIPSPVL
jgi:hypothetical protein